jgi:molybdopterin converting factor small subunit
MTEGELTVHIRCLSGLRNVARTKVEEARFPAGTTLRELSRWIADRYGITAPGPSVMCTLNGRGWRQTANSLETVLCEGDEITLFPLLTGG